MNISINKDKPGQIILLCCRKELDTRLGADLIDYFVQFFIYGIIYIVLEMKKLLSPDFFPFLFVVVFFFFQFFYNFLFELFLKGTPGKYLHHIRVISESAQKPRMGQILTYSIMRLLEANIILFPLWVTSYILAYFTPYRQCFSEKLSHAYVVLDEEYAKYKKNEQEYLTNQYHRLMKENSAVYSQNLVLEYGREISLASNYNFKPSDLKLRVAASFNTNSLDFDSDRNITVMIRNFRNVNSNQLISNLKNGAKFKVYQSVVGLIRFHVLSHSAIYFVQGNEKNWVPRIFNTLITLLFGFLSFTSISLAGDAIAVNLKGGIDVTQIVLNHLESIIKGNKDNQLTGLTDTLSLY